MTFRKIVLISLLFLSQLTAAYAVSTASSHVGITKLATLQVSHLEQDEFITDRASNQLSSNTCLKTGGEPIPYRISASSMHGKDAFAAANDAGHSEIGYDIIWSGAEDNFRLSESADMTDVIQAEAGAGCDNHTLAIEMDDRTFATASADAHTDTLSLIFVIE